MESEKLDICRSLFEWFKEINVDAPHSNVDELGSGVAFALALHQFAPETFTEIWLSKIKSEVGTNWRLKASNLKKVIERLYDYYNDVLNLSLTEFPRPDAVKIAEKHDVSELGRLLQLVLGCAVNCTEKQSYITHIMHLEESLQQNIMKALQDLESFWQGTSSRSSLCTPSFDFKLIQEERDVLAQKCFEAEKQIALLLDEKTSMQQEIRRLQEELRKLESTTGIGEDGVSIGPIQLGSTRYNELRRQLDALKEELVQSETSREDLKLKTLQQEKEISILQAKLDELSKCSSELSQLKDELDVLRESNDKLKICEAQLSTYKKKLEDHNDLKKQIKMLEERSAEYLRQNAQFEEDSKKYSTLKGQVELFKNEIKELHFKLDSEMSKNVKLEFEKRNLESKIITLQRERDNLLSERDGLREAVDELKCGHNSVEDCAETVSKELLSPSLKDKIERLESENKALREGQGGQTALALLLDDASRRNENLRSQLKLANEQILSLSQTTQIEDDNSKGSESNKQFYEQKGVYQNEAHTQVAFLQTKLSQLENTLMLKDQEIASLEARHRKYIERAKEIIKNLDPKLVSVDNNVPDKASNNELVNTCCMNAPEEKLIATAFYKLGLKCQRDSVDAKLAMLMGQGQSFLARQRQAVPKKTLNPNFK